MFTPLLFCIKTHNCIGQEEDLDCQQGVIDFSLYLRSKRETGDTISMGGDQEASTISTTSVPSSDTNMSTVLDQKNYIEELNRHLK